MDISLDIPPELTFIGEKNDLMEVIGNLLDNACKYCLEFVEVSASLHGGDLMLWVDDDGPGIPHDKRELVFARGQRADTLRPGQGWGWHWWTNWSISTTAASLSMTVHWAAHASAYALASNSRIAIKSTTGRTIFPLARRIAARHPLYWAESRHAM